MKKIGLVAALLLWAAGAAHAQQDPFDPGIQDSVILSMINPYVDSSSSYQFRTMQVNAVTDDSVGFYNLPIRWTAPRGGITIGTGTQYLQPLSGWNCFDSVVAGQNYARHIGWVDSDHYTEHVLDTDSVRVGILAIRVIIAPHTPSQVVKFDTCYDDLSGPLLFALWGGVTEFAPAIQRAFLWVGSEVAVDEDPLPGDYALEQNYPNPFNATTAIEFAIPSPGHVTLEVLNILGQRVAMLLDGVQQAGKHRVTWDAGDLPSGIYFNRLSAGAFVETKRMTLLK